MKTTKELLKDKIEGYEGMIFKACSRMRELIAQDKKDSDEFFELRREVFELDMILSTLYQEYNSLSEKTTKELLKDKIEEYEETRNLIFKAHNRMNELIAQGKKDSDEFFQLRREIYELDNVLCTLNQELYMLDR